MIKRIFIFLLMSLSGLVVNAQSLQTTSSSSSEDALRVQSELYEPPIKVDSKTVQKTMYKTVFKQDMKETRPSEAPEEE